MRCPVAYTSFPGEIWAASRSRAEAVCHGLSYFDEVDSGGHDAARKVSEIFSGEARTAPRPLRRS
ncbi:hypothetical protein [Micromonospora orduensis]|uniref:hypothetical protein n=1 Tax=Micromonospora orduensis TaxID=1420891 RepID=UPI00363878EE